MKINVLNTTGFYVEDFIVGVSGDTLPENWTADLVGDGYYQAQYQGAVRSTDTGEWTGGEWVETGGPSQENLIAEATATKATLIAESTMNISLLTDATDPDVMGDDIRPEDVTLLKAWRAYRVFLNRIDVNLAPDIVWPASPVE